MKTIEELEVEVTGILKILEGALLNQEILSQHMANSHEALHGVALCLLNLAHSENQEHTDEVIDRLNATMGKFARRLVDLNAQSKELITAKGHEYKEAAEKSRIIQPG